MLITFTTEHGELVIRAEDLRRLEDRPGFNTSEPDRLYSMVGWIEHDTVHHDIIQGSAAENRDRIVQQEAAVIAAYEKAQRLVDQQTRARTATARAR